MTVGKIESIDSVTSSMSSLSLSQETILATFYERVVAIYYRDDDYKLLNKCSYLQDPNFSALFGYLQLVKTSFTTVNDPAVYETPIAVFELKKCPARWVGLVFNETTPSKFDRWMINLVLATSKVDYPAKFSSGYEAYSNYIVDLFGIVMKNTTNDDQWDFGGRTNFKKKVDFFTSRNLKIEAVLPAFPCKSSNRKKVMSDTPDLGEEIALRKLCDFAAQVEEVYEPGILIWIVSDGHVFSDCIGVNDEVVNRYSSQLKQMYEQVRQDYGKIESNYIRFCSLLDIFDLERFPINEVLLEECMIDHHLATVLDPASETCRKLMMYSCDTDAGSLKKDIKTPGHPRLRLYRGFAKFMEEDLDTHKLTRNLSKKRFKKIVSKVAFEMIKRNDAYSNLVEVIFPLHLRLSIHAHNNKGPKYGIRLLSSNNCRVVKGLSQCSSPNYDDLLHIPTPWHNAIFRMSSDECYYITRAEILQEAIDENTHKAIWNEKKKYYHLYPN